MRLLVLLMLLFAPTALGDVITLLSGARVEGRIIREDAREVEVRTALATITFPRSEIASIEPKPFADPAAPGASKAGGPRGRLPDAKAVRRALPQSPWARGVKQVPAAVVTKGPLRNVPYLSYRADEDYEVNIYGDPAAPVAIEVGLLNMRTRSEEARKNARAFLASLLATAEDRVLAEKLSLERDDQVREGLTFEAQSPGTDRAYGAWWIRVLDDRTMDMERAGDDEIRALSMYRSTQAPLPHPDYKPWAGPRPGKPVPGGEPWTDEEMRRARDLPEATRGMARVYVREFIRKDGAYVRANAEQK